MDEMKKGMKSDILNINKIDRLCYSEVVSPSPTSLVFDQTFSFSFHIQVVKLLAYISDKDLFAEFYR